MTAIWDMSFKCEIFKSEKCLDFMQLQWFNFGFKVPAGLFVLPHYKTYFKTFVP